MTTYIILGQFILRVLKNILASTKFDKFSQIYKGNFIGNTLCLLHVMDYDPNRVIFLQTCDQLCDNSHYELSAASSS